MRSPIFGPAPRPPSAAIERRRVGRPNRWFTATALLIAGLGTTACSGGGGGDTNAFCAAVAAAPSLDSIVRGFTEQEPVELSRNLVTADDAYQQIVDTAPSDIRDETETLMAAVGVVIGAVRENPDDRASAQRMIRGALEELGSVDDEARIVNDAIAARCDLDLNAGSLDAPEELPDPPSPTGPSG